MNITWLPFLRVVNVCRLEKVTFWSRFDDEVVSIKTQDTNKKNNTKFKWRFRKRPSFGPQQQTTLDVNPLKYPLYLVQLLLPKILRLMIQLHTTFLLRVQNDPRYFLRFVKKYKNSHKHLQVWAKQFQPLIYQVNTQVFRPYANQDAHMDIIEAWVNNSINGIKVIDFSNS